MTATPAGRAPHRPGLAARLLAAQLLVIVTAILTAWLVAVVVGPSIFHDHLTRAAEGETTGSAGSDPAGDPMSPSMIAAQLHAEQAFRDASVVSTAVALVAALAVAFAVIAYVTRRIAGPVSALAAAAEEVAAGRYDVTVPRARLGAEFETLSGAFAAMAGRLRSVEATRRRLLGDLAHEMRTPVATLDAYLEGVQDAVATLDADTVTMLRSQTRRLTRLLDDVAAVSRAEEHRLDLRLAAVRPRQLAAAAVGAAAERYADAGVTLESDVHPRLPDVSVDPDRIAQVLGNLLDNALRHTARGGRVVVRVSGGTDTVTLEVSDTGDGITAEHLPHLFERFYRVDTARDRTHGGSGIGLAIVKALVEAHGGRVGVTSDGPGAGAVFGIVLPARLTARLPVGSARVRVQGAE
jgi:signal transduction histidine kinase